MRGGRTGVVKQNRWNSNTYSIKTIISQNNILIYNNFIILYLYMTFNNIYIIVFTLHDQFYKAEQSGNWSVTTNNNNGSAGRVDNKNINPRPIGCASHARAIDRIYVSSADYRVFDYERNAVDFQIGYFAVSSSWFVRNNRQTKFNLDENTLSFACVIV